MFLIDLRYSIYSKIVMMGSLRKHFPKNMEFFIVRAQTHLRWFKIFKLKMKKDIQNFFVLLIPSYLSLNPLIAYPAVITFLLIYIAFLSVFLRSAFNPFVVRQIIGHFRFNVLIIRNLGLFN